jgi:hypothetical protein
MPVASPEGDGWPRPVLALVLARAVNQLGAFAMSFLAVTLVDVYGASLVTAGWVVSLFGLLGCPWPGSPAPPCASCWSCLCHSPAGP